MEEFLEEIHLDKEISLALLKGEGALGELLWVAKEMNHSNDIEETIAKLNASPCFKKELLYEACYEANLFVEETNQTLKEKS